MIMWFLFFTSKKYRQTRTPPPQKKKTCRFCFFCMPLIEFVALWGQSSFGFVALWACFIRLVTLWGLSHYGVCRNMGLLSLGWFVAYYGVYRFGRIMTKSDQLYIYIFIVWTNYLLLQKHLCKTNPHTSTEYQERTIICVFQPRNTAVRVVWVG